MVVLIVNTNLPFESILIDKKFASKLGGIFIRENLGFDFAAWAHAYALCPPTARWTRLFLVNDSMLGPLNTDDFSRTIARLRASTADLIGLVQNTTPPPHLQSFFLVFTQTALKHPTFKNWMANVRSLKEKIHVIDVYETRLTQMMADAGLRTEALFAPLGGGDDTISRWENLLDAGFPYVKASVAKQYPNHRRISSVGAGDTPS
jgi:lipopolysaccharide biosynthesis protein